MPLQNYQYDTIMREYSKTQSQNRRILEERTQEIYKKIPRIHEIDEEVATLSAKKARALLSGESSGLEDLKAAISLLSQERNALLVCNSYPEDYLELPYKCPVCQDTGYVGSQKCTCFKKAEIELLYTQSNLKEILKKENFDHFSFDYYSDTMKNEATGLTERETARRAYDIARGFVRNFDSSFENLFLYGDTGVGKTFLSHCIAHDLLESAHCVMYFSAFDLFELLADSKFSRDKTEGQEFVFDSDLLIIDDLGTELTNSFVSSQLFLCINERIMRRKSTIISTNLKLENFSDTYSERTFSRIASNYRMVKLEGKDIRICMDEWNYWYGPHIYGELGTRYFLRDALGIAAGLNEFLRQSDMVFMANYAQTVNVIGCIKATTTDACYASTGEVLKLYREQFGTVPVKVDGELRPLDVAAAIRSSDQALTLSVINPGWEEVTFDLDILGGQFEYQAKTCRLNGVATIYTLTGPDDMAYNTPGQESVVKVSEKSLKNTKQVKVGPFSANVIVLGTE